MSQNNAEIVRGIYAEWGKGNFRAGTDLYDRHVTLVIRGDFPDAGAYVGLDEIRAYMRRLLADWTGFVIEAEDVLSAGDTVAVAIHQQGTGSSSGISTEMRYWNVWTFRGSKVVRIESIKTRSDVLEAVGLEAPG